ncbi:SDR family oxidoreductase [Pseudonocardia ailaonensis]|uniref:SDR family oxidoreductase n=1 Tax=Pseudonocardia ailaonensis TaxID=367279 RepID=A0ABN2NL32_9PSEU
MVSANDSDSSRTHVTPCRAPVSSGVPVSEAGTKGPGTYVVSGGASGIGAAFAARVAAAGRNVVVFDRDAERLASVVSRTGAGTVRAVTGDATSVEDVSRAVEVATEVFGSLDGILAAAGLASADYHANGHNVFGGGGRPELWADMVLTNVLGPALLAQVALPALASSRGRIVLLGSVGGFTASPGNLYSATKWAVTGLAENLRMYATTVGVGVTLMAPGRTATPFFPELAGPAMGVESVVDAILFAFDQPAGVDVNTVVVRSIGELR